MLLVLFAPALVDAYASSGTDPATRELAVLFARFFLPQVLFYGAGAVMGAYLNTRGRFGAPMWAPVLNNVVVIITCLVFLLLPGPADLSSATITVTQVTVLGVGVTLGIVAQTAVLVPALHAVGFRFLPRLDLRGVGLRGPAGSRSGCSSTSSPTSSRTSSWSSSAFSAGSQVEGRSYSAYVNAFLLWQLPHAVVGVSVITALLPRMSAAAADRRRTDLAASLAQGLRLVLTLMVPAAVAYVVLGRSIATVVFAHGEVSAPEARFVGVLLAVLGVGLVPFSVYQLQLRAFYALKDTRTPTLINLAVNVATVAVDLLLYLVLPARLVVVGLAVGQSVAYGVGRAGGGPGGPRADRG